jgi:hypothetical protein
MFIPLRRAALMGLALAASIGVSKAQLLTTSYTNNFDVGTNTADFSGSGSVSSWIYWYGVGYGNTPMTNDVFHDVNNNASSGSLLVGAPFATYDQCVFFGTFQNTGTYSGGVTANILSFTNITFWIKMAPGVVPRQSGGSNADFGSIGVGIITPGNGYEQFAAPTIPLAASNSWVQLTALVNDTVATTTAKGITFDYNSYGGYPLVPVSFNIDSLKFNYTPVILPPPTMVRPVAAIPGLNCIASTAGSAGQYNRYQVCTAASSGYSFTDGANVTYSWNTGTFPLGTGGGGWQQHFFLVGNYAPGQYDTAADYNLPDVFWVTVQQNDVLTTNGDGSVTDTAGTATMNFRLKTNEASGNSMLFNTTSPTDTVNNPNGWPIEPIATLSVPAGAQGNWTVNVQNSTNITITGPGGSHTNFNITAAQAAIFADPVSICLGGQPNVTTAGGKASVYNSFSLAGAPGAFSDNFLTDTTLNTTIWKNLANDTNGLYLVPATSKYWVAWTLPDSGYSLQSKADLHTIGNWTASSSPIIRVNAHDQALIDSTVLPSASQGYFQLVQYQFTGLQVLPQGETNAPGTMTGYTGTAYVPGLTTDSGVANFTINAVDPTFHIISGVTDTIHLVDNSGAGNSTDPNDAPMVNGTLAAAIAFNITGTFTVTATDVTTPSITAGTTPITIDNH